MKHCRHLPAHSNRPLYFAEQLEGRRLLTSIASGETITASIDVPGEFDEYTFDLTIGETFMFAVAETTAGSPFFPHVQIITPNGSPMIDFFDEEAIGYTVDDLFLSGTYTLRVQDFGANVGGYAVSIVRVPGAQVDEGDAGEITNGVQETGFISVSDFDVFTIEGRTGGTIVFTAATDELSALTLRALVYDPSGELYWTSGNGSTTGRVVLFASHLPMDGSYTLILYDTSYAKSAAYKYTAITLYSGAPALPETTTPQNGARIIGTTERTKFDVFTIDPALEGRLIFAIGELDFEDQTNSGAYVFSSAGTMLHGIGQEYTVFPHDGTALTIIVYQQAGPLDENGYAFTAYTGGNGNPVDADSGPAANGVWKPGTLDPGDIDIVTIEGIAGKPIFFTFGEVGPSNSLQPAYAVWGPDGQYVYGYDGSQSGGYSYTIESAPQSGIYSFVMYDKHPLSSADDAVRPYGWQLTVLGLGSFLSDDSSAITNGQTLGARLRQGDHDIFTADIPAGARGYFSMDSTDIHIGEEISLVHPDGTFQSVTGTNALIGIQNFVAGTYTFVCYDYSPSYDAIYFVSIGFTAAVMPVDQDSGPFTSGQYRRGQLDTSDIDIYSIHANQGATLMLSLAKSEYVETLGMARSLLLSPSGTSLNSTLNEVLKTITNLPETGQYVLIIYDAPETVEPLAYGLTLLTFDSTSFMTTDSGPLTPGVTKRAQHEAGEVDTHFLQVTAGQSFTAVVRDTSDGSFSPRAILLDPSGSIVLDVLDPVGSVLVSNQLPISGTYRLLVCGLDAGSYSLTAWLTAAALPTTGDSSAISSGEARLGNTLAGDLDVYTFNATAGVPFDLRFRRLSIITNYTPRILMYSPTGALLQDVTWLNSHSLIFANPPAGNYTFVVLDGEADATGTYSIAIDTPTINDIVPPAFEYGEYIFDAPIPVIALEASEDLNTSFTEADVILRNVTTDTLIPTTDYNLDYVSGTNRWIVEPDAVLPDGNYQVTINAGSVVDRANLPQASTYVFDFFVLAGDLNRNRHIDFGDLLKLAQTYGKYGRAFSDGNANYSSGGAVNFSDLLLIAQRYGSSLPQLQTGLNPTSTFFTNSRRPIGEQLEMYS